MSCGMLKQNIILKEKYKKAHIQQQLKRRYVTKAYPFVTLIVNMENSKIITQYCENKLLNKTNFSQYMKDNPNFIFQLIKSDLLSSDQEEILSYQKSLIYFQLIKNKLFEEEIELFNKQDIDFVGLKGIFLQCPLGKDKGFQNYVLRPLIRREQRLSFRGKEA